MALWEDGHLSGTRGAQPAASAVGEGVVYYVTDEGVTELNIAGTWTVIATTTAGLDYGEAGDIVTLAFGDSPAAGSTAEVADAGHTHGMPADPVTAHTADADAHHDEEHDLDSHSDVDAPTPDDGDVLTWNDYTAAWEPAVPAGGGDITTDPAWNAAGDLIVADGDDSAAVLAAGDEGDVLTIASGVPSWEVPSGGGDLGDLSDVTVSGSETDGQVLTSDGAGGFAFEDQSGGGDGIITTALGVVLDAPEADDQVDLVVPFDCIITGVTLLADQSGDIVVDVWNDTYGNAPPTDADTITASAPPTLSSAAKSQDTTLTGWTTTLTAGTVLRFNVDSVSTVTRVTLVLHVRASASVSAVGAEAYNSDVQSIPNNTETALTLDTDEWSTDGTHSTSVNTSRMTAPVAGTYLAVARTYTAGELTDAYLRFRKDGTDSLAASKGTFEGSSETFLLVDVVQLAAGEYVEAMFFHSEGTAQDVGHASVRRAQTDVSLTLIASAGGALAEGTSFPGSPTTGDRYRRTDLDMVFFYDGTRWLSEVEYTMPLSQRKLVETLTTSPDRPYQAGLRGDLDTYLTRIDFTHYVATTNDGSHYWTLDIKNTAESTTHVSLTTAASSPSTWTNLPWTTGAVVPASDVGLMFLFTKTGSPGAGSIAPTVYYRLIAT